MHVILASVGTDGDIFTYLGLGAVLRSRGHRVTLAAPETYRGRAEGAGFSFCSLVSTADVERMLASPDLMRSIRGGLMMARWGGPMIARQYEQLAGLVAESGGRGIGNRQSAVGPEEIRGLVAKNRMLDGGCLMVANPGLLAARLVQEKLGVPMASLVLQPGIIASCVRPPVMPGGMTIPRWFPHWLRKAYWWNVDVTGGFLVSPWLNRQRRKLGLRPVRRLFRWWLSPQLVIGLFPSWYAQPQSDWPPQMRLAGFGRYDGASAELAPELRAFCESGSPPIAFTLGTGMRHAGEFFREAAQACEALGMRGILLSKFAEVIPKSLPESVCYCSFAPFRELLPLCSAVVHHGGIGTTAAALEAGCPQLIWSLAWDQPDNGARVESLGVGLSLPVRRRTGIYFQQWLKRVLHESIATRAQDVARRARGENGFEVAAGMVERLERK